MLAAIPAPHKCVGQWRLEVGWVYLKPSVLFTRGQGLNSGCFASPAAQNNFTTADQWLQRILQSLSFSSEFVATLRTFSYSNVSNLQVLKKYILFFFIHNTSCHEEKIRTWYYDAGQCINLKLWQILPQSNEDFCMLLIYMICWLFVTLTGNNIQPNNSHNINFRIQHYLVFYARFPNIAKGNIWDRMRCDWWNV